jgi:TP901 family phage tail tape measure protein
MAREAKIIFTPELNQAALSAMEARVNASAQKMGQAINQATGGGTGGRGGSGGGGGKGGGGLSPNDKAVLRARLGVAGPEEANEINRQLNENKVRKSAAHQQEMAQINERAKNNLAASNANKVAGHEFTKAEKAKQVALRQTTRDVDAAYKAEVAGLKGVERLRAQQTHALQGVADPAARARINAAYERRIADVNIPATANRQGFMSNFMYGFGKAGGMGSALATVVKYGAAYKAVEAGLAVVMTPLNLTNEFLKRGTGAWIEYESAMAKAERTMMMPGMKTGVLKQVLGADALKFITQYNITIQDAAKAIYELGSAGASSASVMQTWQVAAKLNIALDGDMTQTTRLLTQMLKIHGGQMEANLSEREKMIRISGVVAKTWQIEQVELSDLAASYKYVAANASSLGIKMEEIIPLIGFLSTYGLRGSIAGTGLNQMLTQIARTSEKAKDGMLEFHKATRGGEIVLKTGIKYDSVNGPVAILKAIANAAKLPENASFMQKLEQSGMLSAMNNIRGARPLQTVLAHLAEFMQKVGDTSKMTVPQLEAVVQGFVDMQQNTPEAQIKLLNQAINVAGQQFVMAAVGADTFVGALKSIRGWINQTLPEILSFGKDMNAIFSGLSAGMGAGLFGFNAAYSKASAAARTRNATNDLKQEAAKAYLGGTGFATWRQRELHKLAPLESMESENGLSVGAFLGASERNEARRARNAARLAGLSLSGKRLSLHEAEKPLRYQQLKRLSESDIIDLAKRQKEEAAGGLNLGGVKDQIAGMSRVPKAGGGGRSATSQAAKDTRDAITRITDGVLDYEDAVNILNEQLRQQEITEQRLTKTMGGRILTNEALAQSDKLASEQIAGSSRMIEALRMEIGELAREESALAGVAAKAPDVATRSRVRHELAQVKQKQYRAETEIMAQENAKQDAIERASSLRVDNARLIRQKAAEQYEREGNRREQIINADEAALAAIDRTESIYGETVASQRARIEAYDMSIAHLTASRERDEAKLADVTREYQALTIAIENGPSTDAERERQKEAYEEMYALQTKIPGITAKMLDMGSASEKLARSLGTAGLATALDVANLSMDRQRDLMDSMGRDWTTSSERVTAAVDVFNREYARMAADWLQLQNDFMTTDMSPEEFSKKYEEIIAGPTRAFNEIIFRIPADLRKAKEAIQFETEDMRDSWDRKGESGKYRIIDRKLAEYRRLYEGNPEMLQAAEQWGKVAKADVEMKKFNDKREQIEEQWGQAFMKFFTDLSVEGKGAVKALWQSIIGSMQEQILQQFVQKALSGVFDSMATAMTGVDPLKIQTDVESANRIALKATEEFAVREVNTQLIEMAGLLRLLNNTSAGMLGKPTEGGGVLSIAGMAGSVGAGSAGDAGTVMQSLGGVSGSAGGSGLLASVLSGNSGGSAVPAGVGRGGQNDTVIVGSTYTGGSAGPGGNGGGAGMDAGLSLGLLGGLLKPGGSLATIMKGAGIGSLVGGIAGSLFGRDPQSASTGGAIGGAAGGMLAGAIWGAKAGPIGMIVGGLLGGLFGKKKKAAPAPDPTRDIYGMPAFEYESYLYALTKGTAVAPRPTYLTVPPDYAGLSATPPGGTFVFHFYGGDVAVTKKIVYDALDVKFGAAAVASAKRGSIYA